MDYEIPQIAVLADIHANLEALTAVLRDIENRRPSPAIVFLGDSVGYGPDPLACLNLIREKSRWVLAGNHDRALAAMNFSQRMNPDAEASLAWTAAVLAGPEKTFLAGLPLEIKTRAFHFVHGSPYQPSEFHYILGDPDVKKAFVHSPGKIIFVGHTHIPRVFMETEYRPMFAGCLHHVEPVLPPDTTLNPQKRYLINVGSVGQPRDGDNRAAYGLMDLHQSRFELIRVPYDVEAAAEKIMHLGLPDSLADRLKSGR